MATGVVEVEQEQEQAATSYHSDYQIPSFRTVCPVWIPVSSEFIC